MIADTEVLAPIASNPCDSNRLKLWDHLFPKFLMRNSGLRSKALILSISRITEQKSGNCSNRFQQTRSSECIPTLTVDELYRALDHARMSTDVGCVLLTGNGPSPKDGGWAFCSGGDQRIRGKDGYKYADNDSADSIDTSKVGRLHILEVQRLIRSMPKPVIAVVNGWAVGGGHSLHVTCDLTIASLEMARFKQTDTDVASFDGGFGSAYLARQVGQKFAREIFSLVMNIQLKKRKI